MNSDQKKDYSVFDIPDLLNILFHPRSEHLPSISDGSVTDLMFDVPDNARIGARFHIAGKDDPIILFFHGNGEIASDYDDLGPMFTAMGLNFMVFDYRGYGRSTGQPTINHMMADCRILFEKAREHLKEKGYLGRIIVMGRSLGSASAIEIAANYPIETDALIIESGFAFIIPLLNLLGLYRPIQGVCEEAGPMNAEKIKTITVPTLVIHAQNDHIIPFSDGQTLYHNSGSDNKRLLEIKGADHNTIFFKGLKEYMQAIKELADKIRS
ncbi:MAG: lysophospholipase [Proteobacteria bacterium]|nr:lysophospholipase [Pseudomonadota bacterium]